ncbi:aspartate--tRNA ligase msd1 [Teratosphaeriaceae sp. CCFEE 6253]|nr:aspartate--tRNA ligase msd1 [Teratosphaeriaceae sp. CCFEE 6253]
MPETLAPWRCDLQSRRLPVVRLDAASFITELRRTSTSSDLGAFKQTLDLPPATCTFAQLVDDDGTWIDKQVVLHGYLGTRRVANKGLTFAELYDMNLEAVVQLVSTSTKDADAISLPHHLLQDLAQYTPVVVHGTVKRRQAPKASGASKHNAPGPSSFTVITGSEIKLENISPLNSLPKDFIVTEDTAFAPEQRHLQIKHNNGIRDALKFRSKATRFVRDYLADKHGFEEIETPLLFKSTPEGAREFLVPTRSPGLAYALPQSPQQYKQVLMASGIPRYMQIARCFRDEDLRADRQPEFTQVDLEMAFATGSDVMQVVEGMVKALWKQMLSIDDLPSPFPRLTYEQAMSRYGSDKPDTRLGAEISRIDYMLPVDLVSKIGPLTNPAVDVMRLPISDDADTTRQFVSTFMESLEAQPFIRNVDGQPGIFITDSRKPLLGLQPFGFEAAERLEDMLELQDGDLVVLQARSDAPFAGGSTPIGALRLALHKSAVKQGLLSAPTGFAFTWVNDFPLFSPTTTADPGQGGSAGISSTHHPFTAPKTAEDVDLLLTDPLSVKADHYDLVVNGVELGGGSRRIHNAAMQEFVMRDVLKMSDARIKDFAHLIEVLRSGCPPHAGMALGLDRMIAVMLGKESVREVIAFPKSGRGEDLLVKSPTKMTEEQLKTYHLRLEEA